MSLADRAAEHVHDTWRGDPAGAVLLAAAAAERARDVRAKQVFESVFGPGGQSGHGDPAAADLTAADAITAADAAQTAVFSRSSPDLAMRAARAVGAWQDHLTRLVEAGNATRRPAGLLRRRRAQPGGPARDARRGRAGAAATEASIYTEPRQLLTSVFGAALLTEILAKARADLLDRVRLLLDEELVRFVEVIDAAGPCDDVAAIRLYQAEFSLEAVR